MDGGEKIELTLENNSVRKMVEWFLRYYEPSDDANGTPYTEERLLTQFRGDATKADIMRAYELLHAHTKRWVPRQEWRVDPERQRPASSTRPSPFIALKGREGAVNGYVRADRVETIALSYRGDPNSRKRSWGTRISMFNGNSLFTRETPDEVFAKVADALRMPPRDS